MISCESAVLGCSPANGTARTVTYVIDQNKIEEAVDDDCHETPGARAGAFDVCTPTAAFGFSGVRSSKEITFATKCQYEMNNGTLKPSVIKSGGEHAGLTLARRWACYPFWLYSWFPLEQHYYDIIAKVDAASMCPVLGKVPVVKTDTATCGARSRSGTCTYSADTIAGGCTSARCVADGVQTFGAAVRQMSSSTVLSGVQRGMQDMLLSGLLDALRDNRGVCGQPDRTCLARLDGDCAALFDLASDMQAIGRPVLYEAFRKVGEQCVAESGQRNRS